MGSLRQCLLYGIIISVTSWNLSLCNPHMSLHSVKELHSPIPQHRRPAETQSQSRITSINQQGGGKQLNAFDVIELLKAKNLVRDTSVTKTLPPKSNFDPTKLENRLFNHPMLAETAPPSGVQTSLTRDATSQAQNNVADPRSGFDTVVSGGHAQHAMSFQKADPEQVNPNLSQHQVRMSISHSQIHQAQSPSSNNQQLQQQHLNQPGHQQQQQHNQQPENPSNINLQQKLPSLWQQQHVFQSQGPPPKHNVKQFQQHRLRKPLQSSQHSNHHSRHGQWLQHQQKNNAQQQHHHQHQQHEEKQQQINQNVNLLQQHQSQQVQNQHQQLQPQKNIQQMTQQANQHITHAANQQIPQQAHQQIPQQASQQIPQQANQQITQTASQQQMQRSHAMQQQEAEQVKHLNQQLFNPQQKQQQQEYKNQQQIHTQLHQQHTAEGIVPQNHVSTGAVKRGKIRLHPQVDRKFIGNAMAHSMRNHGTPNLLQQQFQFTSGDRFQAQQFTQPKVTNPASSSPITQQPIDFQRAHNFQPQNQNPSSTFVNTVPPVHHTGKQSHVNPTKPAVNLQSPSPLPSPSLHEFVEQPVVAQPIQNGHSVNSQSNIQTLRSHSVVTNEHVNSIGSPPKQFAGQTALPALLKPVYLEPQVKHPPVATVAGNTNTQDLSALHHMVASSSSMTNNLDPAHIAYQAPLGAPIEQNNGLAATTGTLQPIHVSQSKANNHGQHSVMQNIKDIGKLQPVLASQPNSQRNAWISNTNNQGTGTQHSISNLKATGELQPVFVNQQNPNNNQNQQTILFSSPSATAVSSQWQELTSQLSSTGQQGFNTGVAGTTTGQIQTQGSSSGVSPSKPDPAQALYDTMFSTQNQRNNIEFHSTSTGGNIPNDPSPLLTLQHVNEHVRPISPKSKDTSNSNNIASTTVQLSTSSSSQNGQHQSHTLPASNHAPTSTRQHANSGGQPQVMVHAFTVNGQSSNIGQSKTIGSTFPATGVPSSNNFGQPLGVGSEAYLGGPYNQEHRSSSSSTVSGIIKPQSTIGQSTASNSQTNGRMTFNKQTQSSNPIVQGTDTTQVWNGQNGNVNQHSQTFGPGHMSGGGHTMTNGQEGQQIMSQNEISNQGIQTINHQFQQSSNNHVQQAVNTQGKPTINNQDRQTFNSNGHHMMSIQGPQIQSQMTNSNNEQPAQHLILNKIITAQQANNQQMGSLQLNNAQTMNSHLKTNQHINGQQLNTQQAVNNQLNSNQMNTQQAVNNQLNNNRQMNTQQAVTNQLNNNQMNTQQAVNNQLNNNQMNTQQTVNNQFNNNEQMNTQQAVNNQLNNNQMNTQQAVNNQLNNNQMNTQQAVNNQLNNNQMNTQQTANNQINNNQPMNTQQVVNNQLNNNQQMNTQQAMNNQFNNNQQMNTQQAVNNQLHNNQMNTQQAVNNQLHNNQMNTQQAVNNQLNSDQIMNNQQQNNQWTVNSQQLNNNEQMNGQRTMNNQQIISKQDVNNHQMANSPSERHVSAVGTTSGSGVTSAQRQSLQSGLINTVTGVQPSQLANTQFTRTQGPIDPVAKAKMQANIKRLLNAGYDPDEILEMYRVELG